MSARIAWEASPQHSLGKLAGYDIRIIFFQHSILRALHLQWGTDWFSSFFFLRFPSAALGGYFPAESSPAQSSWKPPGLNFESPSSPMQQIIASLHYICDFRAQGLGRVLSSSVQSSPVELEAPRAINRI